MAPPHSGRKLVQQYVATKQGGPFQIIRIDYPTPGPNDICIRNRAVGLNQVDVKNLYYGMMVEGWPEVLGIDAAGVVEAVGEKVTDFKAGDAVMSLAGFGGKAGAFQDVTVVPAHYAARKPSGWTFEEAASVPVCYLTASAIILKGLSIRLPFMQDPPKDLLGGPDGISHVDPYNRNHSISVTKSLLTSMLNNKDDEENDDNHPANDQSAKASNNSNPRPLAAQHRQPYVPKLTTNNLSGNPTPTPPQGQPSPAPKLSSVLVLGGSSGIGSCAIQLLRVALGPGATILSTNSPSNNPHCLKLGANTCIDRSYDIDKLVSSIKNATPNKAGVDAIIDAVGATSGPPGPNSDNNENDKGQDSQGNPFLSKVFTTLNSSGPKLFSQVMTSPNAASTATTQQIASEKGVKAAQPVFGRMTFEVVPGGMRAMSRLTELVESGGGRFKLPLNVEVVGKGLEAIGSGLENLKEGVSGTKLVVSL